jgi:hypothetical protein
MSLKKYGGTIWVGTALRSRPQSRMFRRNIPSVPGMGMNKSEKK